MTRRRTASRRWLVPLGLMLLLGGLMVSASVARAANTLHVTSCLDDGGAATLRGRMSAAGSGDTIVFDQNCTITLTQGTLSLTQNMTVDGTGHTVIVDGNNSARVFAVNSGVTANLTALTIRNGSAQLANAGGGIFNLGTLTVTNSTISGNRADWRGGGIGNSGTMTVTNCTIANNTVSDQQPVVIYDIGGGGIYNTGTLTVTNSTLSGNTAGYTKLGGGILSDNATLTVTNSTFWGNSAYESGGGGIKRDAGTLTVTNSTFSGNNAYHGGGLDLISTYPQNGTTTVTNTIVAGNQPPGHREVNGGVTSGGHNLIGDADGSSGWGASDLIGTDASPLNPLLGSFGSYGGPTQIFPLLPGSPALGGGASGAGIPTTDQRGVARTGHTDVGAFQSQGFTITKTGGDNQSTLTTAPFAPLTFTVAGAGAPYNEPVQGGLLTVMPPAAGASAVLSGIPASLPANGQVSINAIANGTTGGPYAVTVSAGAAALTVAFSLTNLAVVPHSTFTVGTTADHAAGLVSVTTCRTAGNTTCALRDALAYAISGTDTVVFKAGIGPAITPASANGSLVVGASMTITGPGANVLAFDGGCAGCDPGGTPSGGMTVLSVNSGVTATISGVTIQHGNGHGISNGGGTLILTNVTIRRNVNQANAGGAGIYSNGGTVTVQASTITENQAPNGGGAGVHNASGTITVTNSTISGNSASYSGGILNDGTMTVTNSTLAGNNAPYGGGGIDNLGTMTVTNSTITGNNGALGAGMINGGTLTVTNSTITGNNGGTLGGGIYNGGIVTVTNSTIAGNTATTGGGINNRGTVTITNTIVANNTASSGAPNLSGPIATGGHNLFGPTSGATITLGPGDSVTANPLLGTLRYNGGPTQTIALLPGSPAIDAGDDTVCAQTGAGKVNNGDQRGVIRPVGAQCDIGAFEYQVVNALPGARPSAPAGGPPSALPATRPPETTGGPAPNPLPSPRP